MFGPRVSRFVRHAGVYLLDSFEAPGVVGEIPVDMCASPFGNMFSASKPQRKRETLEVPAGEYVTPVAAGEGVQ